MQVGTPTSREATNRAPATEDELPTQLFRQDDLSAAIAQAEEVVREEEALTILTIADLEPVPEQGSPVRWFVGGFALCVLAQLAYHLLWSGLAL